MNPRSQTVASGIAVGFEYYADLGTTDRLLPAGECAQVLYLALDARIRGWDLNVGVGHGLTHAADETTLKAIVGVPF